MLKNDYLLAKIGVDTAENEPRKEWCVVDLQVLEAQAPQDREAPLSALSTTMFATNASSFSVFRDLQSPLSGEKKVQAQLHFSSPEKKYIWWRATMRGALAGRRSTLGQRWVNLGSTLGQPWVNLGSTLGNYYSHLGPILADFAGFVDEN